MKKIILLAILLLTAKTTLYSQDDYHDNRWELIDTVPHPTIKWRVQYVWRDIRVIDSEHCIALGTQTNIKSLIRKTEDGGKTWRSVTIDSSMVIKGKLYERTILWGLCYPSKKLVIAWGNSPYIMRSTDNGDTWQKVMVTDTTEKYWRVTMRNEKIGVANGYRKLMITKDGGESWQELQIPKEDSINIQPATGFIFDENRIVFSAYMKSDRAKGINNYAICRTEDGGKTWSSFLFTDKPEPGEYYYGGKESGYVSYCVNDMLMLDDSIGLCIGARFTEQNTNFGKDIIRRTSDGGRTWEVVRNKKACKGGLVNIDFCDSKNGFATGWLNGEILRTTDGGLTYLEECVDPNGIAVSDFVIAPVSATQAFGANRVGAIYKWLGPEVKSVTEEKANEGMRIVPNPALKGETIELVVPTKEASKMRLELYNSIGESIFKPEWNKDILLEGGRLKMKVDLGSGVYLLKIEQEKKIWIEKIIVR